MIWQPRWDKADESQSQSLLTGVELLFVMLFGKTDYVKGKKRKETESQGGIFVFV